MAYKHHRFPAEIISHGVWLYFRFCLSYRDVEEMLFASGAESSANRMPISFDAGVLAPEISGI
jgi:transposase-like protein